MLKIVIYNFNKYFLCIANAQTDKFTGLGKRF